MVRATPWADAPDREKPSYAELEAEAAVTWGELAYAEDRIRELEQLVRDMWAAGGELITEDDYFNGAAFYGRMRELGIEVD